MNTTCMPLWMGIAQNVYFFLSFLCCYLFPVPLFFYSISSLRFHHVVAKLICVILYVHIIRFLLSLFPPSTRHVIFLSSQNRPDSKHDMGENNTRHGENLFFCCYSSGYRIVIKIAFSLCFSLLPNPPRPPVLFVSNFIHERANIKFHALRSVIHPESDYHHKIVWGSLSFLIQSPYSLIMLNRSDIHVYLYGQRVGGDWVVLITCDFNCKFIMLLNL